MRKQWKVRAPFLILLGFIILILIGIIFVAAQPEWPWSKKKAPSIKTQASPENLERHVRMISEKFVPRDFEHPEVLDQVADYVASNFKVAGLAVTDQPFQVWDIPYKNVIARLGPELRKRIVVGAHYDVYGGLPGADDNASGVAGLIELGRLLSTVKLKTPVELVAYSLEEPPHFGTIEMGSAFHAAKAKKEGVEIQAMISLEMIGYFTDEPGSQAYPMPFLKLLYPSTGNFIAVVGDLENRALVRSIRQSMRSASALPVYSLNAPASVPGVDLSDQFSYWNFGFPGAMVTDTALYRNQAYHTRQDTADRLDYRRMAEVVNGVFQAVVDLAGGVKP